MYIVFIDESGQPGGWNNEKKRLTNNSSKFFTLGGFMINADKILEIETKFKDIKIKYGLKEACEIKWSCSYSKLGLTFEEYKNMKQDIIKMISEYKNSVIGIIMDKENCYRNRTDIKNHNDLYAFALNLLMERVCMEISDRDGRNVMTPALMFTDSRKNDNNNKLDKELQIAYLRARSLGTHYIKFPNFCESLVFLDSNYSCGIQCADFCAGAIHKKFEMQDEEFFNVLIPAIRENKSKNIYGYGIKIYK
ncbi:MAG: DUF3800 domain-containing protein [Clostridia bacterium]|jgi:hypothetical protein|nr:DUF3800 domain-containing protein [Clostridia bacterium]